MKKQPVVYVERELLKRGYGQSYYTYGYVVSKAYLKSRNETYLDDGRVKRNYEVEYIGYNNVNEHFENANYFLAEGYFMPKGRVYRTFEECEKATKQLNENLHLRRISTLDEAGAKRKTEEYNAVKNIIVALQDRYLLEQNQEEKE